MIKLGQPGLQETLLILNGWASGVISVQLDIKLQYIKFLLLLLVAAVFFFFYCSCLLEIRFC